MEPAHANPRPNRGPCSPLRNLLLSPALLRALLEQPIAASATTCPSPVRASVLEPRFGSHRTRSRRSFTNSAARRLRAQAHGQALGKGCAPEGAEELGAGGRSQGVQSARELKAGKQKTVGIRRMEGSGEEKVEGVVKAERKIPRSRIGMLPGD